MHSIKILEAKNNEKETLVEKVEREKVDEEALISQKRNFLQAILKTMGNISEACNQTGIKRRDFYRILESDPEFKTEYEDSLERNLDFAESKLMSEINDGNITSIIFFLKTKGKKRGYIEGPINNKIQEVVDPLEGMTLEEQRAALEILRNRK